MTYKYYRLIDRINSGMIVRASDFLHQQCYIKGRGWVATGILSEYFWDESPAYDLYEDISEEEALSSIKKLVDGR